MCTLAHMLRAEDNMYEPILLLHHVSLTDQTQIFRLGGQLSFLLGHTVCLISVFYCKNINSRPRLRENQPFKILCFQCVHPYIYVYVHSCAPPHMCMPTHIHTQSMYTYQMEKSVLSVGIATGNLPII